MRLRSLSNPRLTRLRVRPLAASVFLALLLSLELPANPTAKRAKLIQEPAAIASLVKKEVLRRARDTREILTGADLSETGKTIKKKPLKDYDFYLLTHARASLAQTSRALRRYHLFKELIPMVEESRFDKAKMELFMKGGILDFTLASTLKMKERSAGWTTFQVIKGSLRGLKGQLILEEVSPRKTLIYFSGELRSTRFPPAFVMEKGAEIVLSVTGQKTRSFVEQGDKVLESSSSPQSDQDRKGGDDWTPRPRRKI